MTNQELISEALRWANGHPNRRSSELMRALAEALEVRQPSEEGEYILRLIETIKQTGGSVEIHGVKIVPCDEYGRTAAVPDAATELRAERDAALGALERARETLLLHNPNGRLVKEVLAALDGAPEPDKGCGTCFTCIERVVSAKPFPHNLEYPFIVCAECGNKRCPKAENHVNACTGSNEPGQPGAVRYGGLPVEGESNGNV